MMTRVKIRCGSQDELTGAELKVTSRMLTWNQRGKMNARGEKTVSGAGKRSLVVYRVEKFSFLFP